MTRYLVLSNFKLTITIILFVFKALNVFLIKEKTMITIGNTKNKKYGEKILFVRPKVNN